MASDAAKDIVKARAKGDRGERAGCADEDCAERLIHPEAVMRARATLDERDLDRLSATFKMLGDPTRVGILSALSTGELCVCDLAEIFNVTPGAVSHQLRLLKAHRLVRARREGKLVLYSLDDDHVELLLAQGLMHVREG